MSENNIASSGKFGGNKRHYVLALFIALFAACVWNVVDGGTDSRNGAPTILILLAMIFEFLANYYFQIGGARKVLKGLSLVCLVIGSLYVFSGFIHRFAA
jgi:hypothetical protein